LKPFYDAVSHRSREGRKAADFLERTSSDSHVRRIPSVLALKKLKSHLGKRPFCPSSNQKKGGKHPPSTKKAKEKRKARRKRQGWNLSGVSEKKKGISKGDFK